MGKKKSTERISTISKKSLANKSKKNNSDNSSKENRKKSSKLSQKNSFFYDSTGIHKIASRRNGEYDRTTILKNEINMTKIPYKDPVIASETEKEKLQQLWSILRDDGKPVDLWKLRVLALSPGGLLHPEVRQVAWPILLDVDARENLKDCNGRAHGNGTSDIEKGLVKEEKTVIKQDVGRSLWGLDKDFVAKLQAQHEDSTDGGTTKQNGPSVLAKIITESIENSDLDLHYYQGYHDLASLMLLNLRCQNMTTTVLTKLCTYHLLDYMQRSFVTTMSLIQVGFVSILGYEYEGLLKHLLHAEVSVHDVALSWVISWFSHDVKDFTIASQILDICIVSHPSMPLYLSAALILLDSNSEKILETDCEYAAVYTVLQKLPNTLINKTSQKDNILNDWIDLALSIMERIPPHSLISKAEEYDEELEEMNDCLLNASGSEMLNPGIFPPPYALAAHPPLPNNSSTKNTMKCVKVFLGDQLRGVSMDDMRGYRLAMVALGQNKNYKLLIRERQRTARRLRLFKFIFGSLILLWGGFLVYRRLNGDDKIVVNNVTSSLLTSDETSLKHPKWSTETNQATGKDSQKTLKPSSGKKKQTSLRDPKSSTESKQETPVKKAKPSTESKQETSVKKAKPSSETKEKTSLRTSDSVSGSTKKEQKKQTTSNKNNGRESEKNHEKVDGKEGVNIVVQTPEKLKEKDNNSQRIELKKDDTKTLVDKNIPADLANDLENKETTVASESNVEVLTKNDSGITNPVATAESGDVVTAVATRENPNPIRAIKRIYKDVKNQLSNDAEVILL